MSESFDKAFEFLLKFEGGYTNDPKDPDGETKYGISKRAYPNLNIKDLTIAQVKNIYSRDYWTKIRGDELPPKIARVAFDFAVNAGVGTSIKSIQNLCGLKEDAVFGSKTLSAIIDRAEKKGELPVALDLLEIRLNYLISIVFKRNSSIIYLKGWTRRVFALLKEVSQ